jgi:hypothetical protein
VSVCWPSCWWILFRKHSVFFLTRTNVTSPDPDLLLLLLLPVFVHAVIGDVRGTGFMLGIELVTDRQLKTPAKDEICHAMEHMKGN